MIHLGEFNTLTILRDTEPGLFLGDQEDNEVLLPNRYVPQSFEIGDEIEVFVYLDNEERIVATTDKPYIIKNQFGLLRCNQVNQYGAFLDWGLVKELFCPFKEQVFKMTAGHYYFVHCYLDEKTDRLVASSKTNKFLDNTQLTVEKFQEVDLIVSHPTDLGMVVVVNNLHSGLIYKDDLYGDVEVGDRLKGYVKKVRNDNKLDIVLQPIGYKNIEPSAQKVMDVLNDNSGFLPLHDKSNPEEIKELLEMSKKSFKKAVGSLYKQRLIEIKLDGIYLV
ncbi:S1-like domain-containing RNA-binding protein [Mangrovimonas sp. AS39]|uniref:CvfB family protein n=1 Tax=Mangrovimonas futianensis TaxID=2895523 RepID=UPI001E2ED85C|nr:S1-like domain-containing RNA-binding protein [Mangrovimonas futianensis]MCF1191561.1 S1-like domain-containing RNA-binding protein [Mangrovimonas futianensis]MCF1195551.1 S1-like domain-containing RNA-binding protein [Mangrovimonas futianensis]